MYQYFALGLYLWGSALYDRITYKPSAKPGGAVNIPRTEGGSCIPLIFGKVRIRNPVLAQTLAPTVRWSIIGGGPGAQEPGDPVDYGMNMFFVLGVPFTNGRNQIHKIYVDDLALKTEPPAGLALADLDGDGNFESTRRGAHAELLYVFDSSAFGSHDGKGGFISGCVEFLNGNASQQLVDNAFPYAPTTIAGQNLSVGGDGAHVPGYRGYMSVQLYEVPFFADSWIIGRSPQVGAYSFVASSFPNSALYLQSVDGDANPADVIRELLTGTFGGCAIPAAQIDYLSFLESATTLHQEGHGYSRVVENTDGAIDIMQDVLAQTNGILFEHPRTGLLVYRLIRPDYLLSAVRNIDPSNCSRLEDFRASGLGGMPNKITVVFTDRDNAYRDGSASAQNAVSSAGAPVQPHELVLRFLGCTKLALARQIASRELEQRSSPTLRCRAVVDNSFRDSLPGDVYRLVFPEYNISGTIMRVGSVSLGAANSNTVVLELVQDVSQTVRGEHVADVALPTNEVVVG